MTAADATEAAQGAASPVCEVVVRCLECGETKPREIGEGTGRDVRYCSTGCAKRAKKRRRRARWDEAVRQTAIALNVHRDGACCIAARKLIFPSQELAWVLIAERHSDHPTVAAFPCDSCSGWHLGNSSSAPARRRRALPEVAAATRRVNGRSTGAADGTKTVCPGS